MIPAGVRQMDRQDDFDDAEDRSGTTRANTSQKKDSLAGWASVLSFSAISSTRCGGGS
jgi:hypothetical protein